MTSARKSKALLIICMMFVMSNVAQAGSASLSWNANSESDLSGYKIYYGTSARTGACPAGGYPNNISVGKVTSHTINNLTDGQTYYFSITALDDSDNESCFSNEATRTIPSSASSTQTNAASPSDEKKSKKKKKKKKTPARSLSTSKKSVKRGASMTFRGKKFSKKSLVLAYFSKPGGGYYPPRRLYTTASGGFTISGIVTKPAGGYSWYVVDTKTGKTSKTKAYRVRR